MVRTAVALVVTAFDLVVDVLQFVVMGLRSHARLTAENLFLRKQLALYRERAVKPRRATNATRLTLVVLVRFIDWRPALTVVQPDTRHPAPSGATCADHGRFVPERGRRRGARSCNHAREVLACDFFVTVTARFRLVYVFLVLEIGTRRLVHWNVTEHPTAAWVVQQFRTCITGESAHRFVVHDCDGIYSRGVDVALRAMGLRALKTPVAVPQANAHCERVIGTARRECLDWMIPLTERHLRRVLAEWVPHYTRGRPHSQLGPGLPDSPSTIEVQSRRHQLPPAHRLAAKPIVGGLHHEYGIDAVAA